MSSNESGLTIEEEVPADKLPTYYDGKQFKATGDALFSTDPRAALINYHKTLLHWRGLTRQNPTLPSSESKPKSQLDEDLGKVYSNMSACYLKLQNYDRTIETADQALALNKENFKALFRKAKALGEQGYFEKAEKLFEELLSKNLPDGPSIKQELETLRSKDKERERKANNKFRGFLNNAKDIFDGTTKPTPEGVAVNQTQSAKIEEVRMEED